MKGKIDSCVPPKPQKRETVRVIDRGNISYPTLFPLIQVAIRPRQQLRYKKDPNRKIANRRYYLHKQLKGKYEIDGVNRTIDVPHKRFKDIPVPDRYYIGQLIKMGYNAQFKIL
jgi:hypothetical protein